MHGHQIGNLDPADEQKIFKEMGGEILEFAPESWNRLIYEYKTVNGFGSDGLTAEYPDGTSELIDRPVSLLTHTKKLRYGMYREGKGTWFSLKYTITYPTSYTVDFNYDVKPKFVFPPDSILYAEDLKQFPRNPENIPEWLQEELRKAETEQE